MLRRNCPVVKSIYIYGVSLAAQRACWERFVKEVGYEPGVKERERESYGW